MLAQLLDLVLLAGAAATVIAGLLLLFSRAPRASVTLVLVLAVLEGSREWPLALGLSAGSINVSWADVATAVMGAVAVFRLAWQYVVPPARAGILGLATMIGIGLISWMLILGLQPAINYWRAWTFLVAAALYAASFTRLREADGLRPFVWAAVTASLMQVVGIARRGFGSNTDAVVVNGELVGARPLSAAAALLMLIGMVVVALDGRSMTPRKVALAAWLSVSVILAQHRSVWVAAAVAGLLVARALVVNSRQRLVTGTLAAIGALVVGMAVFAVVRTQEQLAVSASSTGTFVWRTENWTEKLTTARSGVQWLVGSMFGPTPLSRTESGLTFTVSSHNMYVEAVSSLGAIGLALLLLIVVGAVRGSRAGTAERVIVLSLLAFGLFYQWPAVVWVVLGVAVAIHSRPPRASTRGRSSRSAGWSDAPVVIGGKQRGDQ